MKKDIYYGVILFFIIKSILGVTGVIGYEIAANLIRTIYIAPIILASTATILLTICFRIKKYPHIQLWVIPLLLLTNLGIAHLSYSQTLVEIYSETEKALLFTFMKGIQEISLVIFVAISYFKYYRLR